MIILFGSSGYIGSEFKKQLINRGVTYYCWENSSQTSLKDLRKFSKEIPGKHTVINAAGYTGKPNVDACEIDKANCIVGNVLFPSILSEWCIENDFILAHVSSGCIYSGEKNPNEGFDESDPPNFCFEKNNCSFYSGTKALAEKIVSKVEKNYICRLRMPFERKNNNRNYISKLLKYKTLFNAKNSLTNKDEFVDVSIESLVRNIPYGIYNITNTGHLSTSDIVNKMENTIAKGKSFNFFENEELFYSIAAKAPRSNCLLSNKKILSTGIKLTSVEESIDNCLKNWEH